MNTYNLTGYIPPHAVEAENAVISTLLFNGNHIEWISGVLTAEMFYKQSNALVYESVKSLYDEGIPVDAIAIVERLKKTGKLEEAGGSAYLKTLADKVVSMSNLENHANYILEKYIGRRMMEIGQTMIKYSLDETSDVMDSFVESEKKLAELGDVIAGKSSVATMNDLLKEAYDRMFERIEKHKKNIAVGIDTGLYRLTRITGGWHKGNLIILAGRPGMGKTTAALSMAKSAAKKGSHVLIFSLEMSPDELTDKLIISNTDIDSEQFRVGNVESEISKVDESIRSLQNLPIFVEKMSSVSASYIRSRVREQIRKGCDLVIIDYLNLMTPEGKKNRNRENDVSEMTRSLKMIAKESDVPIICLAQLSRKNEDRKNKKPELADLRESGSIEQDADIVLMCFRPAYYWDEENMPDEYRGKHNYGELIISKNRHGRTGITPFAHNDTISAIFDWNDYGDSYLHQTPY